jgi:hypothetical protein
MLGVAFGTVADVEILWTISAAIGAFFSIINIGWAYGDYKFLKHEEIVNGRFTIARAALWSEVCRFIIQVIFLAIGVFSMLLPQSPPEVLPIKLRLFVFLFQWGMITSSILLTFKTILWSYTRKVVRNNNHIE